MPNSNSTPFFSVVIPTTRPHYLKYSLGSVLSQSFADFEVIIAFNKVPGGAELGQLPPDPRIRVVEADSFLPMHENWENGFRQIKGQWAMLLGDDDCLIQHALEIIAGTLAARPKAEVLLWRWGGFIATDWPSPERGRVSIPPFTGKVEVRTSREVEDILYGFDPDKIQEMKTWLPSVMRGVVNSDIVAEARRRSGCFCHPLTPDYGAAAQIVLLTQEIHYLDLPLLVLNHPADSMAASSAGRPETKASQFYDLVDNPRFQHTVVQARYESNRPVIGETLMMVRAKYRPGEARDYKIAQFLEWHYASLVEAHARGTDTIAAETEVESAIDMLPAHEQTAIRHRISKLREKNGAAPGIEPSWRRRALTGVEQLLMKTPGATPVIAKLASRYGINVFGPNAGMNEISDFTAFVDRLVAAATETMEQP